MIRQQEFLVSELLYNLDSVHILSMKNEFDRLGGAVSLLEFVRIVMERITMDQKFLNEAALISTLRTLFDEIDINGDQEMSWEEFTSYIIKNEPQPGGLEAGKTHTMKTYEESNLSVPIKLEKVEKLRYFESLDRLVVCDQNEVVKLYKPVTKKFRKELVLHKELRGHTGAVLNAENIPDHNFLCTSSTDNTIIFWDANSNFRRKGDLFTHHPQLSMLWNSEYQTLFSSSTRGIIHQWNIETWKEKKQLLGHTDMTMDLEMISNTAQLASASLDTRIYIWDVNSGEINTELKGHVKGVFSLSYNPTHKLLFSASFDRDCLVWNPNMDNVLFRLKGHHTSLIGVETILGTPQVITADMDGYMKLWDIRTLECIQSFTANQGIENFSAFTTMKKGGNRIIAGGKKIYVFDYDKPGLPWLTDNNPLLAALYNNTSCTIFTASNREFKIWDAKSGTIMRTYKNLVESDITAVSFDDRGRKFIVGTSEGNIEVFNYSNGAPMKKFTPHKMEVSSLFCVGDGQYLSSSWDSLINIHDENTCKKKTIIRKLVSQSKDISCLHYSKVLSLIVSGSIDTMVRVWDYDTSSLEEVFKLHHSEITAVLFLEPYPCMCSCDSQGHIFLWSVRPALNKNRLLLRLNNNDVPVNSLAFSSDQCLLYTGDENGTLKAHSMKKFMETMKMEPVKAQDTEAVIYVDDGANKVTNPIHFTKRLSSAVYEAPSFGNKLSSDIVEIPHVWNAHTGAICSLQCIPDPPFLLSASRDKRARAWSLSGEYYGTLRQSTNGGRWNLPLDTEIRQKEENAEIEKILQEVKEGKVVPFETTTTTTTTIASSVLFSPKDQKCQKTRQSKTELERIKSRAKERADISAINSLKKSTGSPSRFPSIPSSPSISRGTTSHSETRFSSLSRPTTTQNNPVMHRTKFFSESQNSAARRLNRALSHI